MTIVAQWVVAFGAIWCIALMAQLISDVSYQGLPIRDALAKDHLKARASYISIIVLAMVAATIVWRSFGGELE